MLRIDSLRYHSSSCIHRQNMRVGVASFRSSCVTKPSLIKFEFVWKKDFWNFFPCKFEFYQSGLWDPAWPDPLRMARLFLFWKCCIQVAILSIVHKCSSSSSGALASVDVVIVCWHLAAWRYFNITFSSCFWSRPKKIRNRCWFLVCAVEQICLNLCRFRRDFLLPVVFPSFSC